MPPRESPLEPRIPVDRALPWKLVPARLFIHAGIFLGVALSAANVGSGGSTLQGMSEWTYVVWIIAGLTSLPLIVGAYLAVRSGGGSSRYFALRMEMLANGIGLFVLVTYGYSSLLVGYVFWRHQTTLAWCVLASSVVFLAWIVLNDYLRTRVLEDRACALERNDQDESGGNARD